MVPGKTYVGILPGHTKPAFIRKRTLDVGRPPGLLAQVFGPPRQAYSVIDPGKFKMFGRKYRDRYYYDRTTDTYRPLTATQYGTPTCTNGTGRVVTTYQQTCASCGKFRSASWQARHPLVPGVTPVPSVCRKCHGKSTSSESYSIHPRRRRHHYHSRSPSRRYSRRYTDSTADYYSSREYERPSRRDRARSREYVRPRSRSGGNVRVVIANQSGDGTIPRREYTRSSSTDAVRVIRRTEIIDEPKRSRSRSRLRSSRASYIEDGARYIDELVRPRSYSRPRSLSRSRYLDDELDGPEYHSGSRSHGRVAFVDDVDDPVIVSRPRTRLSRRRAMIFDGAADTGSSEQEARGRTLLADGGTHGQTGLRAGGEVTEESIKSGSEVSLSTVVGANCGAQTITETITPAPTVVSQPLTSGNHNPCLSRPEDSFTSESSFSSGTSHGSFQPSVEDYESDGEVVPQFKSSTRRKSVTFDDAPSFSNYHEASNEPTDLESLKSPTPSTKSGENSQQQDLDEPKTPLHERRRRYHGSNHSSVSDIALPAPPPSSPLAKLSEMLRSMQMTPPRGSSGRQDSPQRDVPNADPRVDSRNLEVPSPSSQSTPLARPPESVWAEKYTSGHRSRSQSSQDEDSPPATPLSTPPLNSPSSEHSWQQAIERAYQSEGNAYDSTYFQSPYGQEIYEHPDAPYMSTQEKEYPGYEPEIYEHPDAPYHPEEEYEYPSYEPWMELTEAEKAYDWQS
ncbi:hypothetical protein JMJ35_006700 [Cladonia borealis]|uniref:Uncharacterized protein n=1 Tax=Cladonia borealis TaxID=184061 RepID=A0AA39R0M1_9LECA|nr:hypothetical protein JMJ35_006700 [Cladonia borealis]